MICILYVNAVGLCLGLVALFLERAMPAASPRRWIWFVIIPISMAIPGFYRCTTHGPSSTRSSSSRHSHRSATRSERHRSPCWTRIYGPGSNRTIRPSVELWLTISAFLLLTGLASAWRVSRAVGSGGRRGRANGRAVVDGVPVVVTEADRAGHGRVLEIARAGPAMGARPARSAAPVCRPARGRASIAHMTRAFCSSRR